MKKSFLDLVCCPGCKGRFHLSVEEESQGEVVAGTLACPGCSTSHPILRSVPRLVPMENYAGTFGFQWNRFRKTQLDSHTGLPLSRQRLLFSTGWTERDFAGRRVLDVGCGAGRFAEAALAMGAEVTALDYSSAVDATYANLAPHPALHVVQGDIYALPFRPETFDLVYCLGVLQHTPDVKKAFLALPPLVKKGGAVAVDTYVKTFLNVLWPKYWLRPLTRRMSRERLFPFVERMVDVLLPVSRGISRIPVFGRKLRYAVPVMNHEPDFALTPELVHEWAVLNTYDMLSPAHDYPQSVASLTAWSREAGLVDVHVFRKGHMIGYGRRPADHPAP